MILRTLLLLALCSLIGAKLFPRIGKIYKKPNIGLVTFAMEGKKGLTKADKQHILDLHNALRAYLAKGKETHSWDGYSGHSARMPSAANMEAMDWDDDLAAFGQKWADIQASRGCSAKHSKLKDPKLQFYDKDNLGESLTGDISALERDMYGEVEWWNFDKFACEPGKQCGHYKTFVSWGFNHLGCGYTTCKNEMLGMERLLMVCVYGGFLTEAAEAGKRQEYQHEYTRGKPCSKCHQGWDYCMDGGLCATKRQCGTDPKNKCECLHDEATCSGNGGTFDADACTCKCPADKMGINCAKTCKNFNTLECSATCSKTAMESYQCQKSCGSCGSTTSAAYRYYFVDNQRPNKDNLVVRARMENPDASAAMRKPHGNKNCKNDAPDQVCEKLKARGYCKNGIMKSVVMDACKLSCGAKCKPKANPADDFKNLMAEMGIKDSGSGSGGGGGGGGGGGKADMGELAKSFGLNLDGFNMVGR